MKSFLWLSSLIILVMFVLVFPISLLMKNIGELFFEQETALELIQDNLLNDETISEVFQGTIKNVLLDDSEDNPEINPLIRKGFDALDDEDWGKIATLIIPQALVRETSNSIADAIFEWIEGDDLLPNLRINMRSWKRNIGQNAGPIMEVVLDALPDCTPAELSSQIFEGLTDNSGLSALIPACRPPDAIYALVLHNADSFASSIVQSLPEEFKISETQIEGLNQLHRAKETIKVTRRVLLWSWWIVLGIGIIGVALSARKASDWLKWSGWPLLLAGLGLLLISFTSRYFLGSALENMVRNVLQDTPDFASTIALSLLSGIGDFLPRPLQSQGGILLVLGALLFVLLAQMNKESKKEE